MAAGTVDEGMAPDDVPERDALSPGVLDAVAAADLSAVHLGAFLAVHHTARGRFEAAVLQVRAGALAQIGPALRGPLDDVGDVPEHGRPISDAPAADVVVTRLAASVAELAELEDSDGLTPEWISVIVLTGDRAAAPELDELIRRSHPEVPILRPHALPDPMPALVADVDVPEPATVAVATTPAPVVPVVDGDRVPAAVESTLADRFGALNPDWDLGDDDPAPHHVRAAGVRRHERAIVAAAALVLAVAVAGVVSDGEGAPDAEAPPTATAGSAAATRITPVPEDVQPVDGDDLGTAMVTPETEFSIPIRGSNGDNTWVIDFPDSPQDRTRTYTVTFVFDSALTERDVPADWNRTVALPAAALDQLCNGVSSPPVLTTIDRQFASPSGNERVWSGVRIFENSVTAQAALRSTERALGRCDLVLMSDDEREVIRAEIVHLARDQIPDVGDSSFAVATRTTNSRDAVVSLYGLTRWRRCLGVVEYSVDIGRTPTGWPPAVGSERHERFAELLGAAAGRMERSEGDCPSVTPTQ